MNLSKLFELQRQLDERIEREHPRQDGEDRLAKKILALQVEIGELANEARFFKYWSNNQKPRTLAYDECPCGTDYGSCDEYGCSDGLLKYNPLLEEYVDCLHFILSIGLEIIQQDSIDIEIEKWKSCGMAESETIVWQFLSIMYMTNEVYYGEYGEEGILSYELLFAKFIHLGEMLGFTWSEIEQAYMKKNAENHRRQDSGVY
ncbi:hypothetical protein AZI98_08550 [Aeribacillus pallidus]|uniref:dUTPase n=1 Tax=Aeribacillus pallidus TaxID=33936 RepID=A0A165XWC1_9BACI|nr:dUTP diphosphatase [Aeribacillus pallidus]KZN96472.1 hypothetical protein AZI98_08550 [Aeribacillus pallidus]